jgi:hypothetical protein
MIKQLHDELIDAILANEGRWRDAPVPGRTGPVPAERRKGGLEEGRILPATPTPGLRPVPGRP